MNWTSAAEFFAMGGHGFYVWMAYGATLALMLAEAVMVVARRRRALAAARHAADREDSE